MQQRILRAAALSGMVLALLCAGCAGVGHAFGVDQAFRGPSLLPGSDADYPRVAEELGLSGRVGLECAIDTRGAAHDIVIRESGGLVLDDAARKMFADGHFLIPPDWSKSGGPGKRFLYGVIFQLRGGPNVAGFEDSRMTVVVRGVATS